MELQLPLSRTVTCQGKVPLDTAHVDPAVPTNARLSGPLHYGIIFILALDADRDRHKALWMPLSPWYETQPGVREGQQVAASHDAKNRFPLPCGRFVAKVAGLQAQYTAL